MHLVKTAKVPESEAGIAECKPLLWMGDCLKQAQEGMRSSGPLGAHMAARPHLAPPLPPMHARAGSAATAQAHA